MRINKEKTMRAAERALKRLACYQENRIHANGENYEIMYVLAKGTMPNEMLVFAGWETNVISFTLDATQPPMERWAFNYERDLFEYLDAGYTLVAMAPELHCEAWSDIQACRDSDEKLPSGVNQYLGYCKRNGITKRFLNESYSYKGMDAMTFYNPALDRNKPNRSQER